MRWHHNNRNGFFHFFNAVLRQQPFLFFFSLRKRTIRFVFFKDRQKFETIQRGPSISHCCCFCTVSVPVLEKFMRCFFGGYETDSTSNGFCECQKSTPITKTELEYWKKNQRCVHIVVVSVPRGYGRMAIIWTPPPFSYIITLKYERPS